jgi:hypothetical protein
VGGGLRRLFPAISFPSISVETAGNCIAGTAADAVVRSVDRRSIRRWGRFTDDRIDKIEEERPMSLTATEQEVYDYCRNNEFVSADTIEKFRQRLNQEGNLKTLSYALSDFTNAACPKCNVAGAFKWHFLGKLSHPACNRAWYVSPGTYIAKSIKDIFRTGFEVGGHAGFEKDKKGESGGFFGFILGFIMGIAFRAPFAAIMMPIQAVVSLSQKKA